MPPGPGTTGSGTFARAGSGLTPSRVHRSNHRWTRSQPAHDGHGRRTDVSQERVAAQVPEASVFRAWAERSATRVAYVAACVRRSMPSLAKRFDT